MRGQAPKKKNEEAADEGDEGEEEEDEEDPEIVLLGKKEGQDGVGEGRKWPG